MGLWELGTKLGSSFFDDNDEELEDCVEIFEDGFGFESDYFVAFLVEIADTTVVVFELEVMVRSVDFENEF